MFDRERGIGGGKRKFFEDQIIGGFNGSQLIVLDKHFMNLCKMVKPLNEFLHPRFLTESETAYHYLKHRIIGSKTKFPLEEFVEMAQRIISSPLFKVQETLTQEGNCKEHIFADTENKFCAIVVNRLEAGVSIFTTVMHIQS